jgi:putative transferase (TIGR04331 family)
MCDAKIVFIDYPGTPFYEAMSMNVPVILALLESEPFFTEDASAVFQKFEDVGVVYRTPEVAAQFINELYYKDIEQWWNDEKIQSVRREFLDKYANNKPYFWPWAKAILKREI